MVCQRHSPSACHEGGLTPTAPVGDDQLRNMAGIDRVETYLFTVTRVNFSYRGQTRRGEPSSYSTGKLSLAYLSGASGKQAPG
jgi:hypothetical protein